VYNEKLAAKIMAFLGQQFPTKSSFDEVKQEFSHEEAREDQWLLIMDALEKRGLVSGGYIRTGIDHVLRAVYDIQLTDNGRQWLANQGIADLSVLEELADRRFQRTARTIYEPAISEVRNLVAKFAAQGMARSSSFCRAAAEAVFKQLALLQDTFVESYVGTLQETPQGVTDYREAWLNDKLEKVWEEQLIRARDMASNLAQSTGFTPGDVLPYAQEVEIRGRDLKKDIANEIRIAALMPNSTPHRTSEISIAVPASETTEQKRRVFVIHGRDKRLREGMFSFLRSIGLDPQEWPHLLALTGKSSPYVGEVLNAAFQDVQAVVVLLTPDEAVQLRDDLRSDKGDDTLGMQPRPNVLFEAGMAFALQPDRTILVQIGDIRNISDIAGRHMVRMDNSHERRQELAEKLRIAGCTVNTAGFDWHSVGDLTPPK
jgi:predicted nucleotide-binding protein